MANHHFTAAGWLSQQSKMFVHGARYSQLKFGRVGDASLGGGVVRVFTQTEMPADGTGRHLVAEITALATPAEMGQGRTNTLTLELPPNSRIDIETTGAPDLYVEHLDLSQNFVPGF